MNDASWYSDGDALLTEIRRGRHEREAAPRIAGYDDFAVLGRGGQGIVFSATQRSTRRKVAVKVLLDGAFASAAARRRFEREIEVVAALEHPAIVRIFDSGSTDDGRLFEVMEFIDGESLDRWATSHPVRESPDRLAWTRRRVELVVEIAEAVQHAHQRGVIHRDLKPGNIRIDRDERPHVLDFGLAKSFEAREAGAPSAPAPRAMSVTGDFLGSVPWASPEQALGAVGEVDVRSDVYSLGVIAYQLLTERMPYDVTAPLPTVLRAITEEPPAPPELAGGPLDRDLATILLKALSKEPARRYQSAGELAHDLRRWLDGEPIDARRDSAWYVVRMAARRHRATLVGAIAVAVALVAGLGATFWQWRSAERQRERADHRFEEVRGLARSVMFDMHDAIANLEGSRRARELLAKTSMKYLESLAAESGDDPSLLIEIANGHARVGDILGNPYTPNLGDTGAALAEYRRGVALLDPLLARAPTDALRRARAELSNHVGEVLTARGDRDAAIAEHEHALALMAQVDGAGTDQELDDRRFAAATAVKIGNAIVWRSDQEASVAHFEKTVAALESIADGPGGNERDRFNLQVAVNKLGFALGQVGRFEEALAQQERALAISQELARAQPDDASRKRSVEINHNQAGAMLLGLERREEALAHFLEALASARERSAIDPENRQAQADLAYTLNRVGEAHWTASPEDALPFFEEALVIRESQATADPANSDAQRGFVVSLMKVGETHQALAEAALATTATHALARRHATIGRAFYGRAIGVIDAMRAAGVLAVVDQKVPDEARAGFTRCEEIVSMP